MSDNDVNRRQVLEDLVALRVTVTTAAAALTNHSWDSPVELVTVTTSHLKAALGSFRSGQTSADELTEWAELISGRDDVGYADEHRDLIAEALFELASPELFGAIEDVARELEERLA